MTTSASRSRASPPASARRSVPHPRPRRPSPSPPAPSSPSTRSTACSTRRISSPAAATTASQTPPEAPTARPAARWSRNRPTPPPKRSHRPPGITRRTSSMNAAAAARIPSSTHQHPGQPEQRRVHRHSVDPIRAQRPRRNRPDRHLLHRPRHQPGGASPAANNTFPSHVPGQRALLQTTYSALNLTGTSNTVGQHILAPQLQNCYGVGDCLMGSLEMVASGGFRDDADEAAHPFDLSYSEDTRVFQGTCSSGCAPGATTLQVAATASPGTQGEGRFLIDKNPAHVINTGLIAGGAPSGGRQPLATFSGTSFPVSTFLETNITIPSQSNNMAPGTVAVPIVTSGVPTGFATSTAALPTKLGRRVPLRCSRRRRPLPQLRDCGLHRRRRQPHPAHAQPSPRHRRHHRRRRTLRLRPGANR